MPENRDRTGRFKKGKSGNPGGRPKVDADIKAILKSASADAARELANLIHAADPRVALAACREILDRVMGKPETVSKVEMLGATDTGPVVFRWMGEGDVGGSEDA